MKKLLVMMMLLLSSSAFSAVAPAPALGEADSKELYMALSKWGTRFADQERQLIRIDVENPRCIWNNKDQDKYPHCMLSDLNHDKTLTRDDKAAAWLAKLLVRHVGQDCGTPTLENTDCLTAARLIRCWHPWDPKNPPVLVPVGRRFICWLEPIRAPETP